MEFDDPTMLQTMRELAATVGRRLRIAKQRPECKTEERETYELIDGSGLFDRDWYYNQFPDLRHSTCDPLVDFIRTDGRTGRSPNPFFDSEWYLAQYPDVLSTGLHPLVHYLLYGAGEGRRAGPFFDTLWYLEQHPDLRLPVGTIERKRLLVFGNDDVFLQGRLNSGTRVSEDRLNPLAHYLRTGWRTGALPFNPEQLLRGVKIAVVVHLFYPDIWEETARRLCNIPIDYDLFVTVPEENAAGLRGLVLRDHPNAQVFGIRNAGRDVGAFFTVLPKVLAGNYSVLCKIHTKKGSTYPEAWRDLLLRGVLANKLLVTRILYAFARDQNLVLAGAQEVYLSGMAQMGLNQDKVKEIARLSFPTGRIPARWGFFAGTMFWARPDFFQPLLQSNRRLLPFEADSTQSDGQLAHAWERVFGALAVAHARRIGLIEMTSSRLLDGLIKVIEAPGCPWDGNFYQVLKKHAFRMQGKLPPGRILESHRLAMGSPHKRLKVSGGSWLGITARKTKLSDRGLLPLNLVRGRAVWEMSKRIRDSLFRAKQVRIVASSSLFDRTWYLKQYPEVAAAKIDPVYHYVVQGAAEHRDPSPHFDTAWYLAYYPDVAASKTNPLIHYLLHGVKEGRHARPSEMIIGEVTDTALCCHKKSRAAGETALFVTHAPDGKLRAYVRYYLEALSHHGIRPVLIVASDKRVGQLDGAFLSRLNGLYVRQNLGYDFGAWAHILRDDPSLFNAETLYLINDSTIGPLNNRKFEELLLRVRSSTKDLIGLTDSYERQWHIQSYFLALKGSALSSSALRSFLGRIKNLSAKNDVINAYEMPFATFLENGGLSCEVLFPAKKAHNPTLAEWRALLRIGLPFVKVAALRESSSLFFDKLAWRRSLQAEGFDYRLVEEALSSGS